MKNIILKSLTACALLGLTASCSDYLDQKSESSLENTAIFSSYDLAQGAIANIYQEFGEQNYRARSIWYGYNTDIEVFNNSNKGDGKANLATYSAQPNNDQLNTASGTDLWAKIYAAIERCNLSIEGLRENADLSNTGMKQLLGEALTLRALHYVDLINMWGDVPARFQTFLNSSELYPARSDRDVIYKQIIADLQEAQNLCAWPTDIKATETVERVNKAFVKGLLARVCMQAAGYAQRSDGTNRLSNDPELSKDVLYPIALQACKDVIAQEGTKVALKEKFEDNFNSNGISGDVITAGSESLFEIGYSNDPCRGRIMYTFGLKHNTADGVTTMTQGSQVGPVPTLYWEYSKNDSRRDVTCCPFQWNKGVQEVQSFKSWSFGKLRYEWTNRMIASGNDDGINKQYMRYADVILMAAELENYLNGPSAAAPYLTKIRQRAIDESAWNTEVTSYVADASTSKETMQQAIEDERALEFAGELIRKADLIRWGKLKSNMDIANDKMKAIVELTDYDAKHPYSQLSGYIYYQLEDLDYTSSGTKKTLKNVKLKFYGLNYGETTVDPSGWTSGKIDSATKQSSKWISTNSLSDIIGYLYVNDPDTRQYWPIFNCNLNDNVNLKNYEWY